MTEKLMTAPGVANTSSPSGEVVLRTRNLSKHYGNRLAVNNLNLEVRRGEIFGFLGPNGAGKTTTIRMALGLIAPTSGSVEILGLDVVTQRANVLPRVGALVETPALYLYLSGRDNLRAVASVLGGVPKARIDAVLGLVGLSARQNVSTASWTLRSMAFSKSSGSSPAMARRCKSPRAAARNCSAIRSGSTARMRPRVAQVRNALASDATTRS